MNGSINHHRAAQLVDAAFEQRSQFLLSSVSQEGLQDGSMNVSARNLSVITRNRGLRRNQWCPQVGRHDLVY